MATMYLETYLLRREDHKGGLLDKESSAREMKAPSCACTATLTYAQAVTLIMAWQSLVSGAECSTGASPLGSLLKNSDRDTSLHHDRLSREGPVAGSSSAFRSQQRFAGPTEDAQRFFSAHESPAISAQRETFAMHQMHRELDSLEASNGDRGERRLNTWLSRFCSFLNS
jgi:hypothetical protein